METLSDTYTNNIKRLEASGMTFDQAKAIVDMVNNTIKNVVYEKKLATKHDIQLLESNVNNKIEALNYKIDALNDNLKQLNKSLSYGVSDICIKIKAETSKIFSKILESGFELLCLICFGLIFCLM